MWNNDDGIRSLKIKINHFGKFTLTPTYTVKPVYKDHSREPENVVFMSSCPLYTG